MTASSGNRTRAARVAGEHSTTEPTMLAETGGPYLQMLFCQTSSCGRVVKATDSKSVSLWERRFESYQLRDIYLRRNKFYSVERMRRHLYSFNSCMLYTLLSLKALNTLYELPLHTPNSPSLWFDL